MPGLSRVSRVAVLAAGIAALGFGPTAHAAGNPPLRRTLSAYFVFANREVNLKNFALPDACNVGVNCAQPTPTSHCGTASFENPLFGDGSQIAADDVSFNTPGGSIYQLFRNGGGPLGNVTIRLPDMTPDGASPLAPLPILGDLNGNTTPSCDAACNVDVGDLEKACGFPASFPPCDATKPVTMVPGADCVGAADADPGNAQCDLPPGTYGPIFVKDNATFLLVGGEYDVCTFQIGKHARGGAIVPAVLNVVGDVSHPSTAVDISNESSFGSQCGEITIRVKKPGEVNFGRHVHVAAALCAPSSQVRLGTDGVLVGQFVGDNVLSDADNEGHCCGGCACFDTISPTTGHVGDTITLTSACDLSSVSEVLICSITAPITLKTAGEMHVTVPAGAAGSCPVELRSPAGVFRGAGTLTIN